MYYCKVPWMIINKELAEEIFAICEQECEKVNQMSKEEQIRELLIILKCEEKWKNEIKKN